MTTGNFDLDNLWLFSLPLAACMTAALLSIVIGMVSEMWHPLPHYKHEHDEEWIKENHG